MNRETAMLCSARHIGFVIRCRLVAARELSRHSLALLLMFALLAPPVAHCDEEPSMKLPGPAIAGGPKRTMVEPAHVTTSGTKLLPSGVAAHISVAVIPIIELPTEDVDVVEVAVPGGISPATAVWPTEGVIHFINETLGTEYASLPLTGPNISGVDFVSDGVYGVYPTLSTLHIFRMATTPGGVPGLTATVPLPGIAGPGLPARRDIDPLLINNSLSPSGKAVIYALGNEIDCFAIPTGALLWSVPLPGLVVEAVDPVINAANTLLFVPTDGFMTAINPITGAVLSTTTLNTRLVREIDTKFVLGDTRCYLPALGAVFVFNGTPPAGGGTGALLSTIILNSLVIEGNDMEIDPTGAYGFLPTLALMYQINLATRTVAATYAFNGAAHERNQDAVFTRPGFVPAKAVYCTEGTMWIYDVASLGAIAPITVPIAGDLIDGVDPSFTDTPPAGTIVTVSTDGFTHIVDVVAALPVAGSPLITPGVLRIDVDPKPGPVSPGKILQPTMGGLSLLSGFATTDWIVSTSGGLHVLDLATPVVDQFVPTGLIFRGGDAQPTTLLGPPEPGYTVDDPDQDFVTKCNEYKFALNRIPFCPPLPILVAYCDYGPQWVPFGLFGPPAQVGFDLHGSYLTTLTGSPGGPADAVEIFSQSGYPIQTVPLPAPAIGGLTWDWDNRLCKVRCRNQTEVQIDMGSIATSGYATVATIVYPEASRWFPVVDRMDGLHFTALADSRRIWVYDDLGLSPVIFLPLPANIIRRPVVDEQRTVVVAPLANRQVFFVNAHRLRLGLPNATYLSPDLGAHIVSQPVLDVYSHTTIVRLRDNRLVVLSNDTGSVLWAGLPLPFVQIAPFQNDCYNLAAKGFFFDPVASVSYDLVLNLRPLLFNNPAILTFNALDGPPWGVPHFFACNGFEFDVINPNIISYRSVYSAASGSITVPYPMVGDLHVDQVNGYALIRLAGPRMFWIDLFRVLHGISNATKVVDLTDFNGAPISAEEDIAFDTRDRMAVVHLSDGQIAGVSGITGNVLFVTGGFPNLTRQLYTQPFRGLATYPWYDQNTFQGGHMLFDLTPYRANIPPLLPTFNQITSYQAPVEASDSIGPGAPEPSGIVEKPIQPGDVGGVVLFGLSPGTVEPGSTIRAINLTRFQTLQMDDPNEAQAEGDGSGEIAVVASNGDQVCFTAFDGSGNGSAQTCVNVTQAVGAPTGETGPAIAFELVSENPVRNEARFHFSLPKSMAVDLSVYDLGGRLITTLIDRQMPAGEHNARWHLSERARPAAGVYFARFRAGQVEISRRVVLLQ